MQARIGDRIAIESERVGQAEREGAILEVIEASYGTRFRVRWDDGRESTIRPAAGSARIIAAAKAAAKASPAASPRG